VPAFAGTCCSPTAVAREGDATDDERQTMRHRVAHRKLGRVTEHRISMLRNQAQALIRHERIETTVPRAKELRPFVERLITIAKRGIADGGRTTKALHARRLVLEDLPNRATVTKLFDSIAPRFQGRPGGYTRILRLGYRRGDSAEIAQIELVGSEYNPALETETETSEAAAAPTGVGGRLRAAADRLRGKRPATGEAGKKASDPAAEKKPRKRAPKDEPEKDE
jgi:large subunit ribosomal protein L17